MEVAIIAEWTIIEMPKWTKMKRIIYIKFTEEASKSEGLTTATSAISISILTSSDECRKNLLA